MQRFKQRPLFGMGYGTRIVDPEPGLKVPLENILDDQWLTSLLETGVLGVGAWVLLFVRVIRRLGRAAKRDDSDRGSLLVALTAGVAAFAIGMLTYDAFAFVQVSFILFIFIGLGSSVLKTQPQEVKAPLAIRLGRRRRSDRTSVAAETPAG
jgi:O-antigen ligase